MKTTLLVVGAVVKVGIIPQQLGTRRIVLYENAGGATQNIVVMAPLVSDQQVTRPPGALIELKPDFPNQQFTLGVARAWLLAGTGSLNIAQEEYP